jgi:hypothetical protein
MPEALNAPSGHSSHQEISKKIRGRRDFDASVIMHGMLKDCCQQGVEIKD